MKRFGDYDEATRSDAIDMLAAHNIHVWDADFDPNSERVLYACACSEQGFMLPDPKDKSLYTWTPEMVAEYQNNPSRLLGLKLSDDLPWSAIPATPFGWSVA